MTTCSVERGGLQKATRDAQQAREKKMDVLDAAIKREVVMMKVTKNGGIKNAAETLHALLRGSYRNIKEGANSVQSKWIAKRDIYATMFNLALDKEGVKKAFNSGRMDKDISVAIFKLQNGEKLGKSPVNTIAKIIMHFTDKARDDVNAVGGRIQDARDYALATRHDPERMRAAAGSAKAPLSEAFDAWYKDTAQWMSPKTFRGDVPLAGETAAQMQRRIMRDLYNSLYTGVHEKIGSAETGYVNTDTVNISNKVSAHRMIIWKDGEAYYNYAQKYGKDRNLATTVASIFDRMARAGALMEKFGHNPMANLDMIIRRIKEEYKDQGDDLKTFEGKIDNIKHEMAVLDGTSSIPANMGFIGKAGPLIRSLEDMMHLGNVMWTHFFSGVYTIPNMAAMRGISRLDSYGMIASSIFKGLPEGEMGRISAEIGAFSDGMFRHNMSIFNQDTTAGHVASFTSKFMEATGIHLLFDRWKAGIKDLVSHHLASNIDTLHAKLEPHIRNELSRYGINEAEWKLIQSSKDRLREFNGRQYLTPAGIKEGLAGHADADRIADAILGYYSDSAREGVVTPGVKEQAYMYGGTKKGTLGGESRRAILQFKAWPLAAWHQLIERDVYSSLSKKEAVCQIGLLAAIGTTAGYGRLSMNALMAGKPAPDYHKLSTLVESVGASGFLGVLGDSMFGSVDRMSKEGIGALAGPEIGEASGIAQTYAKAVQYAEGSKVNLWPELAHAAISHVPFSNLFYVKGAYDYLLAYHVLEAAQPGWWERTNQRLKQETGSTMTGYSPGAGVPYGIPGVYLGSGNSSSGVLGNGKLK